jgi:hypothetical protein
VGVGGGGEGGGQGGRGGGHVRHAPAVRPRGSTLRLEAAQGDLLGRRLHAWREGRRRGRGVVVRRQSIARALFVFCPSLAPSHHHRQELLRLVAQQRGDLPGQLLLLPGLGGPGGRAGGVGGRRSRSPATERPAEVPARPGGGGRRRRRGPGEDLRDVAHDRRARGKARREGQQRGGRGGERAGKGARGESENAPPPPLFSSPRRLPSSLTPLSLGWCVPAPASRPATPRCGCCTPSPTPRHGARAPAATAEAALAPQNLVLGARSRPRSLARAPPVLPRSPAACARRALPRCMPSGPLGPA